MSKWRKHTESSTSWCISLFFFSIFVMTIVIRFSVCIMNFIIFIFLLDFNGLNARHSLILTFVVRTIVLIFLVVIIPIVQSNFFRVWFRRDRCVISLEFQYRTIWRLPQKCHINSYNMTSSAEMSRKFGLTRRAYFDMSIFFWHKRFDVKYRSKVCLSQALREYIIVVT